MNDVYETGYGFRIYATEKDALDYNNFVTAYVEGRTPTTEEAIAWVKIQNGVIDPILRDHPEFENKPVNSLLVEVK